MVQRQDHLVPLGIQQHAEHTGGTFNHELVTFQHVSVAAFCCYLAAENFTCKTVSTENKKWKQNLQSQESRQILNENCTMHVEVLRVML